MMNNIKMESIQVVHHHHNHHQEHSPLQNNSVDSDDPNGDGEGVWSPDIEQAFLEALDLFPPCGRRKHILPEEGGGKMYGRNELIARYIYQKTGKRRTRKQVSSHIQVLARRKAKADINSGGSNMSSSDRFSNNTPSPALTNNYIHQQQHLQNRSHSLGIVASNQPILFADSWLDRPIVSSKIRLVEFSAFIEYRTDVQQSGHNDYAIQDQDQHQHLNILPGSYNLGSQYLNHYPNNLSESSLPLTSNHHLPAQFNQADPSSYPNDSQQTIISQVKPKQQMQQTSINSGFIKHSYIKIDYSKPESRKLFTNNHQELLTANKLESINIGLIHDKFPELSGANGLYQRAGINAADSFFLIKFWADLNNDYEFFIDDNQNSFFGFSSHFETKQYYESITCSIKACSYGLQVVEKVEKIYGQYNPATNHYSYSISRSPMCEFMIQFIKKLRQLPRASQMNSVLENFTVLQVITNEHTSEILLCLAYVFEIATIIENNNSPLTTSSSSSPISAPVGPQFHVYKLIHNLH